MSEILIAEELERHYDETHAVRSISCTIRSGEFVAITGPSGAGKSTLLALLSGLDQPTRGRVNLDGTDLGTLPEDQLALLRREKVGFVFQSFHLVPSLTALQNVVLPLVPVGRPRSELEQQARDLLERVGMGDKGGRYPAQLSGGERQRVAIARALMNQPRILFADEPTGNLDSATGTAVLDLLLSLRQAEGITLVVVTHDRDLAARADRQLVMRDGRLVGGAA